MMRKIGIPVVAVLALVLMLSATPANAASRSDSASACIPPIHMRTRIRMRIPTIPTLTRTLIRIHTTRIRLPIMDMATRMVIGEAMEDITDPAVDTVGRLEASTVAVGSAAAADVAGAGNALKNQTFQFRSGPDDGLVSLRAGRDAADFHSRCGPPETPDRRGRAPADRRSA